MYILGTNQNPGIIPRTFRELFGAINQHIDQDPNVSPCNYDTTQIINLRDKLTTTENRANILQFSKRVSDLFIAFYSITTIKFNLGCSRHTGTTIS